MSVEYNQRNLIKYCAVCARRTAWINKPHKHGYECGTCGNAVPYDRLYWWESEIPAKKEKPK